MTPKELQEIILCGETSTVQFKRQFTSNKQIAEELVALSNSSGGILLFGVDDKTGEITGLTYEEIQQLSHVISTLANDQIRPVIYVQTEVVRTQDKHVLVVNVHEGINKPYKDLTGQIWIKQGADKRRITENSEILRLFQESENYFPEEQSMANTSIKDIDTQALDRFSRKSYGKLMDELDVPQNQLLKNLHITNADGHLTLAGLLFFGREPQMFAPQFVIKAVSFYGNSIGGTKYRDSKDIEGTIPEMFEQGMNFLKSNLHSLQKEQNFNSTGILEISEIALEEILQNALVHRDYLWNAAIRLLIFDNRVEIINPGCLGGHLTISDIQSGATFQRNPLMAEFCRKTMIFRGLGSGIIRALNEETKIEFINNESANQFSVVIYRSTPPATPQVKEDTTQVTTQVTTQATTQVKKDTRQITSDELSLQQLVSDVSATIQKMIISMEGDCSRSELMRELQLSNYRHFNQNILGKALQFFLIERTQPNSPNSPTQKYRLTEKGKKLKEYLQQKQ